MKLEHVENKHIKITIPSDDEEEVSTVVKVKFYPYGDSQLLVHFTRKSGNIMNWYKHLDAMKGTELNYMSSPQVPIEAGEAS